MSVIENSVSEEIIIARGYLHEHLDSYYGIDTSPREIPFRMYKTTRRDDTVILEFVNPLNPVDYNQLIYRAIAFSHVFVENISKTRKKDPVGEFLSSIIPLQYPDEADTARVYASVGSSINREDDTVLVGSLDAIAIYYDRDERKRIKFIAHLNHSAGETFTAWLDSKPAPIKKLDERIGFYEGLCKKLFLKGDGSFVEFDPEVTQINSPS